MGRTADVTRETKETRIRVKIDLDGSGQVKASTGVGFFDHMLDSFGRHGGFDLEVETKGDLHIDMHHTVEDTGIVIGTAVAEALDMGDQSTPLVDGAWPPVLGSISTAVRRARARALKPLSAMWCEFSP